MAERIYPGSAVHIVDAVVNRFVQQETTHDDSFNAPDAEMARNESEHAAYSDNWGIDW
jgi:hypothetical protein